MNKHEYEIYLQSKEWETFRFKILRFWNFRCALCDSPDNVQVHHRNYERIGHE